MSVLRHKLRRDLKASTGVLLTVVAIISVGSGSYLGLTTAQRILAVSQQDYYRSYRFADFWVHVKKAPLQAVGEIAELEGVAAVEPRISFEVILDLPDVSQPITGRLLSVPARHFADTINGIHLLKGSGFSDDRDEEVILSDQFATAHGLRVGDEVSLILNRKRESFVIVGTAISPEYIYMVRGEGDLVPDPEHFGLLYIKEAYAREVLDFQGACNELVGQVTPGYEHRVDELLDRIDRRLDEFGVLGSLPRERQASHRFVSDEIRGLAIMAVMMPAIFCGVAAMVLNILMRRLAEQQRTIIGTLKALGYSSKQVLWHYVSFGSVVGLAGGAGGIAVGVGLAVLMLQVYRKYYQFPHFAFQLFPDLMLLAMVISLGFATVGTARGVWRVLKLSPAEAMRPRPPEKGGAVFLERFTFLWRRLGFRSHMALRSLLRNRGRTIAGVIASALSSAIIFGALMSYDCFRFMIDFQFDKIAHSDADIGMRDERSVEGLYEAQRLPGVLYAEPMLGVVCDVRHDFHSRRMAISGLAPTHRLTTPMKADEKPIQIPQQGLVLSRKLAEILAVDVGEKLEVTPVRGRRKPVEASVASIVESYLGLECYADIRYLSSLVGEGTALNSVQMVVDPARREALYKAIKQLPNAQGLNVRENARRHLNEAFSEMMLVSLGIMIVFAGLISFGSMLNTSLIEISDRYRDISSFRVLGYRPSQIAGIFIRENLVVFTIGLVLALPLGYLQIYAYARVYDTEFFRMPVVFKWSSVMYAALLSMIAVAVAQYFVYRQIRRLDWQSGVKVKE